MGPWITIAGGGCEMCDEPGIDVDAEKAAEGIARADGKTWLALAGAERDRYVDLAIGALEAIGMERD